MSVANDVSTSLIVSSSRAENTVRSPARFGRSRCWGRPYTSSFTISASSRSTSCRRTGRRRRRAGPWASFWDSQPEIAEPYPRRCVNSGEEHDLVELDGTTALIISQPISHIAEQLGELRFVVRNLHVIFRGYSSPVRHILRRGCDALGPTAQSHCSKGPHQSRSSPSRAAVRRRVRSVLLFALTDSRHATAAAPRPRARHRNPRDRRRGRPRASPRPPATPPGRAGRAARRRGRARKAFGRRSPAHRNVAAWTPNSTSPARRSS